MRKHLIPLLVLLLLAVDNSSASETTITRIRKTESSSSVQIYLTFEQMPRFSHVVKGRRIDIVVDSLITNTEPINFETDDRIVKFLTQAREGQSIITFFMRYSPQKVQLSSPQSNTLVVDVVLGNQFTKAYPELTTKLEGITIVEQEGTDFDNPAVISPYTNNWDLFFTNYEPEIITQAEITYTLPPFPIISLLSENDRLDLIPNEIFALLPEKLWADMIPLIFSAINEQTDIESKKLLALTYGEILLHSGRLEDAFKQLYLLTENYREETVGIASSYLLALSRAINEDPYLADYELRQLEEYIDPRFALSPFILLSQIETSLATAQFERTITILNKDDIAFPPLLSQIKRLRTADYWYSVNNTVKAYVGYTLLDDQTLLKEHPFSLNGYCETLYKQKKFEKAAQCYEDLSSRVDDKESLSMIALKEAMAESRFKTSRDMYVAFSAIEDTYPGTTAGFRAALKKTDVHYLSQPSWRKTSVQYYKALAEKSSDRQVSEEAALKEAIAYSGIGDQQQSINLLMQFLRNYRKSSLTVTAQALLIEILPAELKRLLETEDYVQALVLAKQNRELFQNNWVDLTILSMLAKAYHELSIFEEASKLYIYLLRTSQSTEKQVYYLPLISILFNLKEYENVRDYSAEYSYNFPDGKDRDAIFIYRLQSLILSNKNEEAKNLLAGNAPDLPEVSEIAGEFFFKENNFQKTIQYLLPLWKNSIPLSIHTQFILAESLYSLGETQDAKRLFLDLMGQELFYEHSRYRLATLERKDGNESNALKLFKEIVEKGKDPLWIKLATRELEYSSLKDKY